MRNYPRTTLAIALLATGWIGTAATGAMAEENHGDADKAAMDAAAVAAMASGGGSVSVGIPVIVGSDGDGHPVVEHRGPGAGSLSAGVPVITGAGGDGHPRIAHLHAGPGGVDESATGPGR
jgi:hypothetical protein